MKFYASVSGLTQKQDYTPAERILVHGGSVHEHRWDVFVKFDVYGLEIDASYYQGKGLGTTGLFSWRMTASAIRAGPTGYLCKATYKIATSSSASITG
jgi:hypothetical protein